MDKDSAEEVTLRLTARQWATIDATIDNVVAVAVVDPDDEDTVARGRAIRQVGWDQVPWVDGELPPMKQEIAIRLTRAQWTRTLTQLEDTVPVLRDIGEVESERLTRDAISVVREQLDLG